MWSLNSRELVGILRGVEMGSGGDGRQGEHHGHCDKVFGVDASEMAPIVVTGGGPRDRTVKVWVRD